MIRIFYLSFWRDTVWHNIKCQYQKFTRGYSGPEWYSFLDFHSEWCIPRLKHLRNHTISWPGEGMYEEIKTFEDWQNILDQIIEGFESNLKLSNIQFETNEEGFELRKKLETGLTLFAKYYWHLWD